MELPVLDVFFSLVIDSLIFVEHVGPVRIKNHSGPNGLRPPTANCQLVFSSPFVKIFWYVNAWQPAAFVETCTRTGTVGTRLMHLCCLLKINLCAARRLAFIYVFISQDPWVSLGKVQGLTRSRSLSAIFFISRIQRGVFRLEFTICMDTPLYSDTLHSLN